MKTKSLITLLASSTSCSGTGSVQVISMGSRKNPIRSVETFEATPSNWVVLVVYSNRVPPEPPAELIEVRWVDSPEDVDRKKAEALEEMPCSTLPI
jgi:hypothetical protein